MRKLFELFENGMSYGGKSVHNFLFPNELTFIPIRFTLQLNRVRKLIDAQIKRTNLTNNNYSKNFI